ncbi:hypothetical protein MFMK1_001144 [Metallumcola ferriviriculae]|uniref:Uncharacterized protein n=1 Tax=Metallumcola ferriviriculae TaxID=3039180 RepID=A0AAU0UMB4_9FIRM|nr:hypothetical protein MFMK1_001144 [Desulfitibacteraceae bacterium MK1]
MKGFRKMDEMEKYISYKSVFWSYSYMVAFLAVWVAYNALNHLPLIVPLFLFITQMLLQSTIRIVLKKRMGG